MSDRPVKMTAASEQVIRDMWPTGARVVDIAAAIGCHASYVSIRASHLGLAPRLLLVTGPARRYMVHEAARRGVTPRALKNLIYDAVVRDRLVDAVLDDGAPTLQPRSTM